MMRIKNMNVRCPDPEMTKERGGGGLQYLDEYNLREYFYTIL